MPFIEAKRLEALVEDLRKMTPAEQHETLMRFLCTSPLDDLGAVKKREDWDEKRVPPSLRDTIRTPVEELDSLTRFFLKSVNPVFFKSVWNYLENPYAPTEFDGVAVIIDQSSSTQQQQGLDPKTINKTLSVMHRYFMIAMSTFRLLKDALVGDAISLVGKAPEDNVSVVAVEGARFLLTVRSLFSIHDILTRLSPEALLSRLRIRGAMSVGRIGLSDNPIQATAACPLMNQTSRFVGFPPEMSVVTNPEGAKYLKRYFNLTPMKVGGDLLAEIAELTRKAEDILGRKKSEPKAEELFEAYEAVFRRMRLNEIIHNAFERPNLPDDFLEKQAEYARDEKLQKFTVYLDAMRADRKLLEELRQAVYKKGVKNADGRLAAIEGKIAFALQTQPYVNYIKGKFKGLSLSEMDVLHSIDGYKTFAGDFLATPKQCLFRSLFLEQTNSRGESPLEEFVQRTGIKYGFPVRTNFNLMAPYYIMYTMQLSGSPDFAFQSAVRALGMAIYGVEKLQENWGRQPDVFREQVQNQLVERGIFNEKGEVQKEKFVEFMEKAVVLPSLLNELGILRLFDEVNKGDSEPNGSRTNECEKIEATASWLAKHFGDFQGVKEQMARELIKNMGPLSARMLEELNAEFGNAVPGETIEIIKRIKFQNTDGHNRQSSQSQAEISGKSIGAPQEASENPLPADLEWGRNIVMASRAIQSMRKLKAYKQKQRMSELPWETIQAELKKIELQPFIHGLYYDLFLEKSFFQEELFSKRK
ncbi:MAG: hypothetical protein QXH27_05565 [Candidatus Micrarchaeia archaeon]